MAAALSSPLWLRPLAEHQASAALGRPVEIRRLRLRPGSPLLLTAEDVLIGNPLGFPPGEEPLLRIPRLTLGIEVGTYLRRREIVISSVELDRPVARAVSTADGRSNFAFDLGAGRSDGATFPKIGAMRVSGGHARVSLAELGAEFEVAVSTRDAVEPGDHAIRAEARGTYADQPMAATLLAGGLPGLGGPSGAWPIELHLTNGPTRATLKGRLQTRLDPRSAAFGLLLAGPDLALLAPLTGVPLPATPPYELGGKLDYSAGRFHFTDIAGRIGRSDVEGTLTVTRGPERPHLTAELHSRSVDLRDIAGLLGGGPGPPGTPGQTPQQQAEAAHTQREANASPRLLPDRPLNLPKLRGVDAHLTYRAERIQGRSMPLDNLTLRMDLVDGVVALRPLSFRVGAGRIAADVLLTPGESNTVQAKAEVRFERLDLARLMQATGTYQGEGALSGTARVEGAGRSVADILGHGDGALLLSMAGGDLSRLLVNLAGLRLGSALLGSLGGEARTPVECFVADLPLRRGVLSTRALLLETEDAVIEGRGIVDLQRERVEIRLWTKSKRLTVGVLPVPLLISGTLKAPSAAPDRVEGAGGGIAGALAALPTIRFGTGDDPRCDGLLRRMRQGPATGSDAPHGGASSGSGRR
ncbi:AsmA family protein [Belnapia sp. T6]|uniref:AsmA family protein n=1 Tax=Belnapia mucosa TaxID=2804532 RepID=A0ABS1VDK2_9PROT|nr:AsmA family protein [Belnapia mucosa]MBL6459216.1 AsmA family protein [Belnapia mucosa]